MAASRYRNFLKLVEKWPLDAQKGESRDLGAHIRKEIEAAFKEGDKTIIADEGRCDKIYESIEQLVNNKHSSDFPTSVTVGAIAKDLEHAKMLNSEEMRDEMSKVEITLRTT